MCLKIVYVQSREVPMRPFEPFAYLCKNSDAPCLGKWKLYGSWSLELFRAGRDRTWKWSLPGSSCSLFQLQTWPAHHPSTTSHPGPTPSQKDGGFHNPALHVVSSIFGKDSIRYSYSPFTIPQLHFPGKFPQSPHVLLNQGKWFSKLRSVSCELCWFLLWRCRHFMLLDFFEAFTRKEGTNWS